MSGQTLKPERGVGKEQMLYLLTGDIQTGKTRWLSALIDELALNGIRSYGVLTPGLWKSNQTESGETAFEKLGIDAILLPQKERFSFAQRRDLAERVDPKSQSTQAMLHWEIDDRAIQQVNQHFDRLSSGEDSASTIPGSRKGLLVVDELGPLEILYGQGYTSAVTLLEAGPSDLYDDALVVVRNPLCEKAEERFAHHWPATIRLLPDKDSRKRILEAFD